MGRWFRPAAGLTAALALATAAAALAGPPASTEPAESTPPAVAPVFPGVPTPPSLSAAAAILMDWQTGIILYQKDGFSPRPPASTTKVLTAVLALERGDLEDWVTVSPRAARTGGSSLYLRADERHRLGDLLQGMLLQSGNDAAVAIAEHLAGSVETFAGWMNQRARELGARNSRFVNPHGLHDPGHYSTAYDLALITRHALRNPVFAEIVRQRDAQVGEGDGARVWRNLNRLLWMFEGADGVKTGTTSAAGACLISSATRSDPELGEAAGGHRLVAVVLRAGGRWRDSVRLLEWGFDHFQLLRLAPAGEPLGYVPVRGGQEPWATAVPKEPLAAVVPRVSPLPPQVEVAVPRAIPAPIRRGAVVGTARVRWGGTEQAAVPLVAVAAVGRATWVTVLARPLLPVVRWLVVNRLLAF